MKRNDSKTEIPTFNTIGISDELPSRKEMRQALKQALEAIVFQVQYLSDEGATNVIADEGGLERHAPVVELQLKSAMHIVRMYEALQPAEQRP